MSKKKIKFDRLVPNSSSSKSALGAGPRAVVYIRPPGGSTTSGIRIDALVDTGADGLFLPTAAVQQLGYPLGVGNVTKVQIVTAGGLVTMDQRAVFVSIYGVNFSTNAYLYPNQEALIGRTTIFSFLQAIGFRQNDWLLKFLPTSGPNVAAQSTTKPTPVQTPAPDIDLHYHEDYLEIGSTWVPKHDWDD